MALFSCSEAYFFALQQEIKSCYGAEVRGFSAFYWIN